MTPSLHTRDQAKARAKALRAELAADNRNISHSAALERVAAEQGFANWNTLSARLSNAPEILLQVGDRVEGHYLKQPFAGVVLAVRSLAEGGALRVTIEFDEPVDVVAFESFSHFRRRISGTVSTGGVSYSKTSDGVPHLIVGRAATPAA